MITYEQKCRACGNEFEVERSINDTTLVPCPKCGEIKTDRMVSGGTGFVLLGACWTKDGYASSKE